MLGLTVACARCHDHKFDPIPTEDYYALAGIFTSTEVMEQRYMLGQQRKMEQLIGLGVNGDTLDAAYEKFWRERPALKKAKDQAAAVLETLEKADEAAFAKLLESHVENIASEARDLQLPMEQRIRAQKEKVAAYSEKLDHPPAIPPRAMISKDVDQPADESIRRAGQFDRLGDKVPRGFLRVIGDSGESLSEHSSGRIELARWLTDMESGAGPLTARVWANRIWHHLIGQGLVRTVDNFGVTGEPPTHPDLLDYLASRLVESGWSTKSVIREIVLSKTFAMSSEYQERGGLVDPGNHWLWRANRRRMDPESMREAMLFAAGKLDLTPMDSSVWYLGDQATAVGANTNRRRTDFPNRSVYLPVIRNDLPEVFEVFDFTDPHITTGARPKTTVPTQGLFMLNDRRVMDLAESAAKRALSIPIERRLDLTVEHILNRGPSSVERKQLLAFLSTSQDQLHQENEEEIELKSWTMLCHAMFSTSRFHFLE